MPEKHSCFDCPCPECWREDGYAPSRCSTCKFVGCPPENFERTLSDVCAQKLQDDLSDGVVVWARGGGQRSFDPSKWKRPKPGVHWLGAEERYLAMCVNAGYDIYEIARNLRRTVEDVDRKMRRGFEEPLEVKPEGKRKWCAYCGRNKLLATYGNDPNYCKTCADRFAREARLRSDCDDEDRLRAAATEREANVAKKSRERMREKYGANPRKWAEWLFNQENEWLGGMADDDRLAFDMLTGAFDGEKRTVEEVSELLGITQSHAQRIEEEGNARAVWGDEWRRGI